MDATVPLSRNWLVSVLYFVAGIDLCLLALVGPVFLALATYELAVGGTYRLGIGGSPIGSEAQKIASLFVHIALTLVAYSFLYLYRKRPQDRARVMRSYTIVTFLVLPLILVGYSLYSTKDLYKELLRRIDVVDVVCAARDAQTGEKIRHFGTGVDRAPSPFAELQGSWRTEGYVPGEGKIGVRAITACPLILTISAEGYGSEQVEVPPGTRREITVSLKRP